VAPWDPPGRNRRIIGAHGTTVDPLDLAVGLLAGAYCGRPGTNDVIDATVVIAARQHGAKIVSSDRDDLLRLDSGVEVIPC